MAKKKKKAKAKAKAKKQAPVKKIGKRKKVPHVIPAHRENAPMSWQDAGSTKMTTEDIDTGHKQIWQVDRNPYGEFRQWSRIGFSGVNMYSVLDVEEKNEQHWQKAVTFWKAQIKAKAWEKKNKAGQKFDRKHYIKNLKYAKAMLKKYARHVREQKTHIKRMLK